MGEALTSSPGPETPEEVVASHDGEAGKENTPAYTEECIEAVREGRQLKEDKTDNEMYEEKDLGHKKILMGTLLRALDIDQVSRNVFCVDTQRRLAFLP